MKTKIFGMLTRNGSVRPQFALLAHAMTLTLVFAGFSQRAIAIEGMTYPVLEGVPLVIDSFDQGKSSSVSDLNVTEPFNIVLDFNDNPTASEAAAFAAAKATWESIITGYLEDVGTATVTIDVNLEPIDGPGGILGSAGPRSAKGGTSTFLYTNTGEMTFDTADTAGLGAALNDVILHEMGHVLGIGTLWSSSSVGIPGYQELYRSRSGQYTGAFGLAAYNAEFSQAGTSVPVELGGGGGTSNSHWNEVDGGAGLTGIVSNIEPGPNNDFRNEFMTGWLNSPSFISSLTTEGMRDLGYNIASVSEPIEIVLDIKPGPSNNTVALNGNGILQMAILASEELDVLDIDIDSLLFGDPLLIDDGATSLGASSDKLRDLNHDGLDDLLVGFSISGLVDGGALDTFSVEGQLTGELFDGTPIFGSDIVRMVPQNKGAGGSLGLSLTRIPEPSSVVLLAFGMLVFLKRGQRRF